MKEETQPRCSCSTRRVFIWRCTSRNRWRGEYFHTALRREREPRDGGEERMALDVAHATASGSQTIARVTLEQLRETRRKRLHSGNRQRWLTVMENIQRQKRKGFIY